MFKQLFFKLILLNEIPPRDKFLKFSNRHYNVKALGALDIVQKLI